MFDNITLTSTVGIDLSVIIEFIGCLIFSFMGSILKEIYNTNSIIGYEFEPHKVISSTIVASLSSAAFKIYVLDNPSWELMAFVTFTFGLLGFELFKDLSTVDGIKRLISEFKHIMSLFVGAEKKSSGNQNHLNNSDGTNKSSQVTPRVHKSDKLK